MRIEVVWVVFFGCGVCESTISILFGKRLEEMIHLIEKIAHYEHWGSLLMVLHHGCVVVHNVVEGIFR